MRVRVKVFAAAAIWALAVGAAHAGALDECMVKGDHAAITRCLAEQDAQAQAQLRAAEGAAATWARELDRATGRPGAAAALAASMRTFADYRKAHCDYVRAIYASGTGAEQGMLGCRIDMTRRRVRELQR
jgi:uncharacterized protein YecT (DUF1311 family)